MQNKMQTELKYKLGEAHPTLGLYRIVALRDFSDVKTGDIGGWISNEENLSHDGNAWVSSDARIYDNAQVFGDAEVSGDAQISGDAQVYGNARIYGNAQVYDKARFYDNAEVSGNAQVSSNAQISGDAEVSGNAQVYDNAQISGDAEVSGDARIYGNVLVSGDAEVSGDARIYGNARISGDALVSGNARICGDAVITAIKDHLVIGPVGDNRFITATKSDSHITAGCFSGTLLEFRAAVTKKYPNGSDYDFAIVALEAFMGFAYQPNGIGRLISSYLNTTKLLAQRLAKEYRWLSHYTNNKA